jgi:GNAT superfamily N-acetyltransferase
MYHSLLPFDQSGMAPGQRGHFRRPGGVIRRLKAGEWQLLRDIRMRALADAPNAFAATLEQARAFPDDEWQRRARGWRAVGDVTFVCDGDGMVVGVRDGDDCWLGAMWVAPERRRDGVGTALANAVLDWARSWGAGRVLLGVAEGNRPAAALYERLGFMETGSREVVRDGLIEIKYALDLETAPKRR